MSEKILLIDGHSILNRAFYGLPDLTNSEGKHTGAVYGFLNILFRTIEEEKPQYLTVAFDLKAPTFRHKMFEAYKGTRKGMPEELLEQAMRCMDGCRKVICCRESFGTLEDAQKRLLAYAKARGLSERNAQNYV